MKTKTFARLQDIARQSASKRRIDPDDLLQDVLEEILVRGLDIEENLGLVIVRLKWLSIDRARKQISSPEVATDFVPGWEASVENPDTKRPGRSTSPRAVSPNFEVALFESAFVEFVRNYIVDMLTNRLEGDVRKAALAYYVDGTMVKELEWNRGNAVQLLYRARNLLTTNELENLGAWDYFNRPANGRRRIQFTEAEDLGRELIRLDLV